MSRLTIAAGLAKQAIDFPSAHYEYEGEETDLVGPVEPGRGRAYRRANLDAEKAAVAARERAKSFQVAKQKARSLPVAEPSVAGLGERSPFDVGGSAQPPPDVLKAHRERMARALQVAEESAAAAKARAPALAKPTTTVYSTSREAPKRVYSTSGKPALIKPSAPTAAPVAAPARSVLLLSP